MYTLDTNAIIYYLKGDRNTVATIQSLIGSGVPVYVSTVTEVELLGFRFLTKSEWLMIENLLNVVSRIPVDSQIARLAAQLRRESGLDVPDAVIAATALFTGSALVTRNIRDFRKIVGLSLKQI